MAATATKEVTIGSTRYQLGRLSARQGSWVASQFQDYVLARLLNPDQKLDERPRPPWPPPRPGGAGWPPTKSQDSALPRLLNPDQKLDERQLALMLASTFSS